MMVKMMLIYVIRDKGELKMSMLVTTMVGARDDGDHLYQWYLLNHFKLVCSCLIFGVQGSSPEQWGRDPLQ